ATGGSIEVQVRTAGVREGAGTRRRPLAVRLLLGDLHVVDRGLDQAGRAGVGDVDQDADRLAVEAADVGRRRGEGRGDVGRGARDVEHRSRGGADHPHPEEVGRGGVVEVREVTGEGEGQRPGGGQRDRRRLDGGGAAVDVVDPGRSAGGRAGDEVV